MLQRIYVSSTLTLCEIKIGTSVEGEGDVFQGSLQEERVSRLGPSFYESSSTADLLPYQVLLEVICYVDVPVGCKVANGLQQVLVLAFLLRLRA